MSGGGNGDYEWSKLRGLERKEALEKRRKGILDRLPNDTDLLKEWEAVTYARDECVSQMVHEEIQAPKETKLKALLEIIEDIDTIFFTKCEGPLRSTLVQARAALWNWNVINEERLEAKRSKAPPPAPPPVPPPPPPPKTALMTTKKDAAVLEQEVYAKPACRNALAPVGNTYLGHSFNPNDKPSVAKLDLVSGIAHAQTRLKKSNIVRSPGGTPARKCKNMSTEEGLLSSALKRRFHNAQSNSPEPWIDREAPDSSWGETDLQGTSGALFRIN